MLEHGSLISGFHHGQSGSLPDLKVGLILVYAYYPLIRYIFYKYFLPSCRWPFQLCSLCRLLHRGFKINVISFVYFYFMHLVPYLRNHCWFSVVRLHPCFPLRVLSSLAFRSLIHSELIFLHDVRSSLFCIWIFCFPSTIRYRD